MKKLWLLLLLLAVTIGGSAMIETLTLEDLAAGSDLIVSVTVLGVKETGKTPEGVEVCANLVEVAAVHKGDLNPGEKIKIKTFPNFEDGVKLTEKREFLLFLKKEDNFFLVNNAVQGCWELDDNGKFTGMGTDYTLDDVKKAIEARPSQNQEPAPDLQL